MGIFRHYILSCQSFILLLDHLQFHQQQYRQIQAMYKQMQQYRQHSKGFQPLTIKKIRHQSTGSYQTPQKIERNYQEISSSMIKVSSCQYLNDNLELTQMYKNSSSQNLNNQISHIRNKVQGLVKRNPSFSKADSSEVSRDSQISYKYQPDPQLLKKELVILRNKFDVKKHQYRKEIEDLKKQIILWERVNEENEDKFAEYKEQVEKELNTIKGELERYIKMAEKEDKEKYSKDNLSKGTKSLSYEELHSSIKLLEETNSQLSKQITRLQEVKEQYQKERQVIFQLHEEKVQNLTFSIENLKEKISILQNIQMPVSKIAGLEKQVEEFREKNKKLEDEIKYLVDVHQQIEGDLLKVIQDDSENEKLGDNEKQKEMERLMLKEKQKDKEDDSFYKLSNSVYSVSIMPDPFQALKLDCKQCENNKAEFQQLKKLVQNLTSESIQRTNEFQFNKTFLQNKIFELQRFVQVNQSQIQNLKTLSNKKSVQIQSLKARQKQLVMINSELEQKIETLQQYRSEILMGSASSPPSTKCSNSEINLQEELDTKTKQLLIIKTQAINCTDLYVSKCRQLEQKKKTYQRSLSQYQYKIEQLTITIEGLQNQLKSQTESSQQMIFFLKQQLQRLQYIQTHQQYPSDFNEVLKIQIDEINSLHETIKFRNEEVLKLKQIKSELQVSLMNMKGEMDIEKLKKISEIKSVEINMDITTQNLKNELNISKRSEGSLINKLKYLTEECKNKDQFIEKYIRNKNIQGSCQTMLNDYKTLTNMDEFRINLHHELVLIDKLENEKVTLMQNIKRLEDVNKMQENGIEME